MYARVRVYGDDNLVGPLLPILRGVFEAEPTRGDYQTDHARDDAVHQSDILICHVGGLSPEKLEQAHRFIYGVINLHGAFIYITTVIVGAVLEETSLDLQRLGELPPNEVGEYIAGISRERDLLRLRVAAYVPASADPVEIAKVSADTFKGCWWYGVRQQEIASLVVGDKGQILRANTFAEQRLNAPLVGRSYLHAVEGSSAANYPEDHPILRARKEFAVRSGDRQFRIAGRDEPEQFFLICSPLQTVRRRAYSCAVMLLDMSRWNRIVRTEADLLQVRERGDLYRLIVEHGTQLGMTRVRLYQHHTNGPEGHEGFLLRAASGYTDEKLSQLVDTFFIKLSDDKPSEDTVGRKYPRLCIYDDSPTPPPRTDLVEVYTGRPNFAEHLDKEMVWRWIEVPIWLPGRATIWGKMSIDLGPSASDTLGSQDVAVAGLFVAAVANALVARDRADADHEVMEAVRDCGTGILKVWAPVPPTDPPASGRRQMWTNRPHQAAVTAVLRMYQRITGADILLYRERDREEPDILRSVGEEVFHPPGLAEQLSVPKALIGLRPLTTHFPVFATSASESPRIEHRSDLTKTCDHLLTLLGNAATPNEVAYLTSIRGGSELQIPVYRNGVVNGVILAVSFRPDRFTDEIIAVAERLVYVAGSWIELAREHGGHVWVEQVLGDIFQTLPLLANVPLDDDTAFYAGLATLLTAHCGVCWNRAILMVCPPSDPETAVAVYALGGLATADGQSEHRRAFHTPLTEGERPWDLVALVRERINNPVPIHRTSDGHEQHDALYDLCVPMHAGQRRISLPFGCHPYGPLRVPDLLVDLLAVDFTRPPVLKVPLEIGFDLNAPPSARQLHEENPGLFSVGQGRRVYAFPFWCPDNQSRTPLGVVFLDNQHPTQPPPENMIAVTRVVLGLVADLFATRLSNRRLRGIHKKLPAIVHPINGLGVDVLWGKLREAFERLRHDLGIDSVVDAIQKGNLRLVWSTLPQILATAIERVRADDDLGKQVPRHLSELYETFDNMHRGMDRVFSEDSASPVIPDLGAFLREFTKKCNARAEVIELKIAPEIDGLTLPCDEIVLGEALYFLHSNSKNAIQGVRPQRPLRITLTATLVEYRSPNIDRWVHIRFADNGPSIEGLRPYVFIRGATTANPAENRGRGLGTARIQLSSFGGDLQLVDTDPKRGETGATFEIRFGIPTYKPGK